MTLTLRTEVHPNGQLMHHVGTVDGVRVEAHQSPQAAQRAAGTWFLTIGTVGNPLRCRSQHATLTDARQFANRVITAAGPNPTHAELLTAVAAVENGTDTLTKKAHPVIVVPCGAAKSDEPAPAALLYTSQHFQLVYRAARKLADDRGGRVLILSALHGLVDPTTVIDPYDVKMGDPDSITTEQLAEQLTDLGISPISTMLPKAYRDALTAAGANVDDLYADAPGIGYQRGVAARILAGTGAR
jgi:hypothetical protein